MNPAVAPPSSPQTVELMQSPNNEGDIVIYPHIYIYTHTPHSWDIVIHLVVLVYYTASYRVGVFFVFDLNNNFTS